MGVEEEHERRGGSPDAFYLTVGDGSEAWVAFFAGLSSRGAAYGCGSVGGGGEAISEVGVEDGGAVVALRVDYEYGAWWVATLFFEGGYDDFLGGCELPAEKSREAVAPYVWDAWLA